MFNDQTQLHCVKNVQIRGKCGPEKTPYLDTFHAVSPQILSTTFSNPSSNVDQNTATVSREDETFVKTEYLENLTQE